MSKPTNEELFAEQKTIAERFNANQDINNKLKARYDIITAILADRGAAVSTPEPTTPTPVEPVVESPAVAPGTDAVTVETGT